MNTTLRSVFKRLGNQFTESEKIVQRSFVKIISRDNILDVS